MSQIERLFIAEKPSLAETIAGALGEMLGVRPVKSDGCWEVGNQRVTWFFGHMYEMAQPSAYGERWAKWTVASLPIVIDEGKWILSVPEDKKGQVRKVAALVKAAASIVNAGDPAREGQLLVDEALIEMGVDAFGPNVFRLWAQSMTRRGMITAINEIRPNADKRSLYFAAVCRQRADFQHGMTFSRLYTLLARASGADAKISVGRVQTPTLRLVVDRDRERIRFKPVDHFLPQVVFRHANGSFAANWVIPADHDGLDSEGRLVDRKVAEAVVAKIAGKAGRITAFASEPKSKAPPLPYSLSALQSDAGTKLGLTAKEVLDIAQALYEKHRATSYPRTDSRHLPTGVLADEAPGIMQALRGTKGLEDAAQAADMALRSAAWDDSKVSDHYGLIPTSEFTPAKLAQMDDNERAVFLLIARSFIAQFHPPFRWRAMSAEVACEGERFRATGRQVTDQGWKRVYGAGEADDEDDAEEAAGQALPSMAAQDPVEAGRGELVAKRTSPPPAFSDPSLIAAMANVHRFETNPEYKKLLREGDGIGTEATRADTIQTNLTRGFLKRKGKVGLESTELGRSIIDALPEDLKGAALTAIWERGLGQVERGQMAPQKFLAAQAADITAKVDAARGTTITVKGAKAPRPVEGHGETCAKCGQGIMVTREIMKGEHKGKTYLSCSRYPECDHRAWPQPKVDPLPGHGEACPQCGTGKMLTRQVTSKKDGKQYVLLACSNYPTCKHSVWPEAAPVPPLPGHGKTCPACGTGQLLTKKITAKATGKEHVLLSCNNYPACKHGEWPEGGSGGGGAAVDPLPGDGKECPACHKGHMRTKEFTDKETKQKRKMLSCDAYPACRNAEWPERGAGGSGGRGAPAKATVGKRR